MGQKTKTVKSYITLILDGMARGLFGSLIIGVIIKQIGVITGVKLIENIGQIAQYFMGPAIGAGVAYVRGAGQFTLLSSIAAGAIGAGTVSFVTVNAAVMAKIGVGEPVGALIAALVGLEIGKKLEGKTKFDLLLVPATVIMCGGVVGVYVSPVISAFMTEMGNVINSITLMLPLPMGVLLGVVVGMVLTLPISSAALCISIKIGGIAAGAALAGCCAQMVGFAVISYRENKFAGLIAQGIGTSMLQIPNIVRNPWIWVPPTVAGGVCGALSTLVFKLEATSVGAGMGTAGLVGPFTTVSLMGASSIVPVIILYIIIPAVLSLLISELMRKKGLIKEGDMKL